MVKSVSSLIVLFLVGLISASFAYGNGEIKEIVKNEVWAGEIPSPKDPDVKIYFGIERLDNEQQVENWKAYARSAEFLSGPGGGPLKYLAVESEPGNHPKCEDLKDVTGLEEAEFNALMETMEKMELYLPENREGLDGVSGGILGFNPHVRIGNYVVYAAKKPVSGRFRFKELKVPRLRRVSTLKEFQDNYSDILMSMASWEVPGTPLVSHRGIFRNPMDFVDPKKTYGGISLLLHAFSAEALSKMHPGKKFMAVTPVIAMADILKKNFKSNEMFVLRDRHYGIRAADGKKIPKASTIPGFSEFIDKVPVGNFERDGTFLIDIDALAKPFR
jgi:hypothetical protein